MKRIGIAIAGGTGYGAHELLRLLVQHPLADVVSVSSQSEAGKPIASFHRDLIGCYDSDFESEINYSALKAYQHQVLFVALPHGLSIPFIRAALQALPTIRIIDLSGDLRLKDPAMHQRHYPQTELAADLREGFVFGLTELNRKQIGAAQHIANPGCYPTAASLAAAPLVKDNLITGPIVINAASGTSGAGRTPGEATHHPRRHASMQAYKPLDHRHEAEIQQTLLAVSGTEYSTMFVPHLLPIARGIYVSLYATLSKPLEAAEVLASYRRFYSDDPFVRVLETAPELGNVVGSNFCDLFVHTRDSQVVVFAAEDNLVKGMAGQAIQNMNCMLGLAETSGLLTPALGIV